jgi:hypothetical protein
LANAATLFWQVYSNEVAPLDWAKALEPRVVRHALVCLLARVAGKSPLEYLTPQEVARQRDVILLLIANPPTKVSDFITHFIQQIETHAEN